MKNIKTKLVIPLFILAPNANSQELGIKAGFNSTFTNHVDYTSLPGFQIGVFSKKKTVREFFYSQAGNGTG